jgi:hypothetical protein
MINQRMTEDQTALQSCAKQDEERHTEQMGVLNKLADYLQGMNDQLCDLSEQQGRTNQYLQQQELDRREADIRR